MSKDEAAAVDLTFVTTADLLEELNRRHKAILIVREMISPHDANKTDTLIEYDGGLNVAVGMAERARHRLLGQAKLIDDEDDE